MKPDRQEGAGDHLLRVGVAVALSLAAGYVDAVGWLSLDRVFTAQMSGNLVLFAVHLAAGKRAHILLQGDAILSFFLGLLFSGGLIEFGMRRRIRRIFVAALAVEFVMLAVFAVAGGAVLRPGPSDHPEWPVYALIAVVAGAMGVQNTSLRMAGILPLFTTHVTGALTDLSEELIVRAGQPFRPRDRHTAPDRFAAGTLRRWLSAGLGHLSRTTALLLGFFLGALAGAALLPAAGIGRTIAVPLVLLLAIGAIDWVHPLTRFPSEPEANARNPTGLRPST